MRRSFVPSKSAPVCPLSGFDAPPVPGGLVASDSVRSPELPALTVPAHGEEAKFGFSHIDRLRTAGSKTASLCQPTPAPFATRRISTSPLHVTVLSASPRTMTLREAPVASANFAVAVASVTLPVPGIWRLAWVSWVA